MSSVQPPCAKDLVNVNDGDLYDCLLCGSIDECWKESGKLNYMEKYVEGVRDEALLYGREAEPLVMLYALLAKAKGEDVTDIDVHDAWSLWTAYVRNNPDHPSNIPFSQLDPSVQDMDKPYTEAIRKVAREV